MAGEASSMAATSVAMRFMIAPRYSGRIVKIALPVRAGYETRFGSESRFQLCRIQARADLLCSRPRQPFNQGAREARHGQGSDAQQQGKEETEAGQEPEKGRRRALAVRLRQVVATRQEGLTARPSLPEAASPPAPAGG